RFEIEQSEFFTRVRETYLKLAEHEPERFVVVDATQDIATVQAAIGEIASALISNAKDQV
ncbi:MAG: dTMP kinase, partial [Proteobacteria bacterium]|nr:dTMP kinase [Pseudomonadota bacterium]